MLENFKMCDLSDENTRYRTSVLIALLKAEAEVMLSSFIEIAYRSQ
jgi:hypothetical protein